MSTPPRVIQPSPPVVEHRVWADRRRGNVASSKYDALLAKLSISERHCISRKIVEHQLALLDAYGRDTGVAARANV
jgi:hypothetical protein